MEKARIRSVTGGIPGGRRGSFLIGFLTVVVLLFVASPPAHAELADVGPANPDHGFPFWYEDTEGTKLELCLDPNDQNCLQPFEMPDPTQPVAFPDNFPEEAFWWAADASIDRPGGARAQLVLAKEAAFVNGSPAEGDQMSFGRVRARLDGLVAGESYTVTHPYGVDTVVAEPDGSVFVTEDIGCFPSAIRACDFRTALSSRIGPFLRWNPNVGTAPPAGYLGDPNVAHEVVGSPIADANDPTGFQNFFRVEGPDVGGPGVNRIETRDFLVTGKLATLRVASAPREKVTNDPDQTVGLVASEPQAEIFYTTDGSDPSDPANPNRQRYTAEIPLGSAPGTSTDTQIRFVAVNGTEQSQVVSRTYTVDLTAPNLTADPPAGAYPQPQTVRLATSERARVHYTTDGSNPDPRSGANPAGRSFIYDPASPDPANDVNVARSQTIRAIAVAVDAAGNEGAFGQPKSFRYTISSLSAVGPINPQGGFPFWYEDAEGTRLDLCLDPNDQMCLQPFEMPDPAQPVSFPDNFPGEAFWWAADATFPVGDGDAILVLAKEAAFANEEPRAGDQMSFGRVRVRVDNLEVGAEYRVRHPYGTDVYTATDNGRGAGEINVTEDIGCFPAPGAPCDFNDSRFSRIGPFLKWDPVVGPVAPAGYLGDPAVPHTVVGSPVNDGGGNPQNFFRVEKLAADGTVAQVVGSTADFNLTGKLYTLQVGASHATGFYNAPMDVLLRASEPGATIYYTTDGTDPVVGSSPSFAPANGQAPEGTVRIGAINQQTTLKYLAVDQNGNLSKLYTERYTLDDVAPTVAADPAGGAFQNTVPPVTLSVTNQEPGPVRIFYTTDGSDPSVAANRARTLFDPQSPIQLRQTTTLRFVAVDAAGNASQVVTEQYDVTDTLPPEAPTVDLAAASDTGASPTDNTTNDTTPTFTGNAEPGSTVRLLVGGQQRGSATANTTDGSYSVTTGALTERGNLRVTATATDVANNTSVPSAALSMTLDTTNPTVAASPRGGTYPRAQSVALTPNEEAKVYYTRNGGTPTPGAAGTLEATAPINVATNTTLRFLGVDTAGNRSGVAVESYTIRNLAPTITNFGPTGTIANPEPVIRATVRDPDSTLARSAIAFTVDGQARQFDYDPNTGRLTFQRRWGLGRHNVLIAVRDGDGGTDRQAWSFRIR